MKIQLLFPTMLFFSFASFSLSFDLSFSRHDECHLEDQNQFSEFYNFVLNALSTEERSFFVVNGDEYEEKATFEIKSFDGGYHAPKKCHELVKFLQKNKRNIEDHLIVLEPFVERLMVQLWLGDSDKPVCLEFKLIDQSV